MTVSIYQEAFVDSLIIDDHLKLQHDPSNVTILQGTPRILVLSKIPLKASYSKGCMRHGTWEFELNQASLD